MRRRLSLAFQPLDLRMLHHVVEVRDGKIQVGREYLGHHARHKKCWRSIRAFRYNDEKSMHAHASGTSATLNALRWRRSFVFAIAVLRLLDANRGNASVALEGGLRQVKRPTEQTLASTNNAPETGQISILLLRAAERGDPMAQFAIGAKYATGDGVPRDDVEAVGWWRRAAEQGFVDAELSLAAAYLNGLGVPKDHAEAVMWYRKAAEQGDPVGQLRLGELYAEDETLPLNTAEAVRWWRKSADQGNVLAQNHLGQAFHDGVGVPQDYTQAFEWYRKAAEQGLGQAQTNLGFMYQNGESVARDPAQAVQWWRKAAAQGSASALYNLAVAYHNGDGVVEDYVEAYKWVVIAEDHASDDRRPKYAVLHNALAMKMTAAQIDDARQRIQMWTESFVK
jgi:TPR repeat protein